MMLTLVKRYVLELTVFACGAVVMVYEIIGSRIVSPFIGTSTYVWTSLIGVILASLSLGYWLGGKLADRHPEVRILAIVVFVAGGLVSMTLLIKDLVLTAVAATPTGLEIKSVFAAILLFAPASVALGFVTPLAIRLKMTTVKDSGSTVGRLYALSTIGSIAGTFAAGFILVPFVGSTRTLYLIAGVLFLISLLLAPFAFSRTSLSVLIVFALGIMGNELTSYYQLHTLGLRDVDTEYSRVQIFQATDSRSGRPMRALMTDPHFVQSVIYLDGEDLFARYTHFYHLLRHLRPQFQKSLMIGGAGYSFPQDYLRKYPDATIDVVEIDPAMTEIAREHFRLQDDPEIKIFHDDGRVFLNRAETGTYDAVLMDAFGSLFSVPHHLTTIEAVRQIDRVLDPEGVVIFNIGSALTGESNRFLQAELATYKSVFPFVHVFKVNPDSTDERTQNVMIVACKTECSVSSSDTANDPEISRLLSHRYYPEIPLNMPVLTDDLSPVEYYNSLAQNQYRR